ncbi:hypothetical protein [Mucilaginibacter jinjuensis]|uniref:Ig-like domain-containing protein n=1 Tax=Mucilaginibacter jinjuensis TaxID=1176721 RepID=A0ABY7T5U9_9SPHI|nr:hypothetical protein [Mucilaginibacter jinjuensis]WCT11849.1 hypothetical protein PQO05_24255 [Mucilaginibacter jinjuensis]
MKKSTLFRTLLPIIIVMAGITAKAQITTLAGLPGAAAVYCAAEAVKLQGNSTGTTYVWKRYPGKDLTGTPVTLTETTNNLSDVPPAPGYYTYVSTASNTNCTSDVSAPTTIYALPTINAAVTGPATVCVSAVGSTILTATGSNVETTDTDIFGYTYKWFKNGTAITGATGSTYTLSATNDATVGTQAFTVQISYVITSHGGSNCGVTSSAANVDVQANPTTPTVTIMP